MWLTLSALSALTDTEKDPATLRSITVASLCGRVCWVTSQLCSGLGVGIRLFRSTCSASPSPTSTGPGKARGPGGHDGCGLGGLCRWACQWAWSDLVSWCPGGCGFSGFVSAQGVAV